MLLREEVVVPLGPMPDNALPERVFHNLKHNGGSVEMHKSWKIPDSGILEV